MGTTNDKFFWLEGSRGDLVCRWSSVAWINKKPILAGMFFGNRRFSIEVSMNGHISTIQGTEAQKIWQKWLQIADLNDA